MIVIQKRLRIIIILAIIAGFLLGIKFLFVSKKPPQTIPFPTPNPLVSLTPITTPVFPKGDLDAPIQIRKEIPQDYPLFQFIPYKTANWQIDYLKPLTLEVIMKNDTQEIRQEVVGWIQSKGVNPSTHQILWKTQFQL